MTDKEMKVRTKCDCVPSQTVLEFLTGTSILKSSIDYHAFILVNQRT